MATFEETVLALDPIHFWRLDELSGPTMTDIAVGGVDGTYFAEADFGRPSPVETDPSSSAIGKRVGRVVAPAPAGNWSYGGFIYTNLTLDAYLICRSGQVGLAGGNFILWDAGASVLRGHVSASGTNITLNFIPSTLGTYLWVMLVRNGTTVSMYVNDALGDTSSSFVATPMGNDWVNGGQFTEDGSWKIGCGGDTGNLGNLGDAIDEPMVFDYPLTLADSNSIRQAALNSLFLHGYSNVVPSAVWISGAESPPIHYPFRHNFEEPLLERISFLTNNSKTLGGSVESSEMRIAPRREVEINNLIRSDEERRALRAKIWAHQHRPWFVPIRQDFEQLSASLASGAQTLPTVTQYKDYEVDSWVGLRELDDQGRIIKSEVLQVDALNPNDVHTATATVNSYSPFLSYIYPVRRGIISRSFSIKGHTDAVEELVLVFELLAQDEAVIPNRIVPWTPTIVYKGYEAHDPAFWQSHNWIEGRDYEIDRASSRVDFETGIFEVDSDTPGAEEAFEYRMLLKGRDKIAQFLGWFYSRGGSLSYLWVPSMQKDFSPTGVVGTEVTVEGTNYSENFGLAEARRNLAFVYQDNTMALRTVTAFAGSPNEDLTLSPSPPTLVNLRSLSLLKFCQMESDSVELAWLTDDLIQVAWRFKELLSTPD